MKVSETDECEIKGDEWKKLSDQAKETLSKEVRSSEGAVRQGFSDLPHERRHKGEGHRSAEEMLQQKEFKKASKDKDALKKARW